MAVGVWSSPTSFHAQISAAQPMHDQKLSSQHNKKAQAAKEEHTKWIEKSLREIETIKVGTPYSQFKKVFTTEGGVSVGTFVYRDCPYIKVEAEFQSSGSKSLGGKGDVVVKKISRPFLAWSIGD